MSFFNHKCISFYQPEYLDEFALSKDLMVYLWTQYWTFAGKEPLREVFDGNFIFVDDDLYDDFKLFKKNGESFELSTVLFVLLRQLIFLNIGAYQL